MPPKLPLMAQKMVKKAKDDMELAKIRKSWVRNEMIKNFAGKAKDDTVIGSDTQKSVESKKIEKQPINKTVDNLPKELNISKIRSAYVVKGYKAGKKVRVYDINNSEKFVQIIWPKNPTVRNLLCLVKNQIKSDKSK